MSSGMEGDNEVRAGAPPPTEVFVSGVISLQEREIQEKEARHKRSSIVGLHLFETSRIGRSIEIEGWWLPGLGIGEMGRNCLRDSVSFRVCRENVRGLDRNGGCTIL